MIAIQPTIATVVKKLSITKTQSGIDILKVCVAINDNYVWCATFGHTALYLNEYCGVGDIIFIEDWNLKQNDKYFDFTILKTKIIKKSSSQK